MDNITTIIDENITGLISSMISFVPVLIIGIIIIGVGYLIARVIRWAITKLGASLGLDRLLDEIGLSDGLRKANIKMTPSGLAGSIVFWVVFLNFLLQALEYMGLGAAVDPLRNFINLLPSIIVGLVVFVLGTMVAQFLGRAVSGATAGIGIDFHEALGNAARILTMGIVFIIAIQQVGLDVNLLTGLFINLITIVVIGLAVAFGLGGRSVARNVLAGFYARELYTPGDLIRIDEQEGMLDAIGTLNSEIRLASGVLSIPNTRLTEDNVLKLDS